LLIQTHWWTWPVSLTQPMHVCEGLGPYGEEKDEII
jgi:hypothetical protein